MHQIRNQTVAWRKRGTEKYQRIFPVVRLNTGASIERGERQNHFNHIDKDIPSVAQHDPIQICRSGEKYDLLVL